MRMDPAKTIVENAYDAALASHLWPAALEGLAGFVGAIGAAYIVSNKRTGRVEWACFSGPSVEFKAEYVDHYAALDPYLPHLHVAEGDRWHALSECLSDAVLRRDAWYNDFVLKSGVSDILGARLLDSPSHTVILGVHREVGKAAFPPACVAALNELLEPLGRAAGLHAELRDLGWKSCMAPQALDQLGAAVIFTDDRGRVVDISRAAERIMRRDDGLTVRDGRLTVHNASDDAKLGGLIAAAAKKNADRSMGRMYVVRGQHRPGYLVTVAPVRSDPPFHDAPLAMILVGDPQTRGPTAGDLTELFRLSRAEGRVAGALAAGNTVRGIAAAFGVQITTVRTQLAAIMKKVGVGRQSDLMRVFSDIPSSTPRGSLLHDGEPDEIR